MSAAERITALETRLVELEARVQQLAEAIEVLNDWLADVSAEALW